jgi:hypothetical protein
VLEAVRREAYAGQQPGERLGLDRGQVVEPDPLATRCDVSPLVALHHRDLTAGLLLGDAYGDVVGLVEP